MAIIAKPPYFESVVNAGEQRLLEFLEINLPSDYYLIPNVELASTNPRNNRTQYWEYDLIVVAPHAIYNIENKDWKGRIEGDDNYWYINDRQTQNPLKTGRQKTAILASKLKEQNYPWYSAWVQSIVTLSYPNTYTPSLWQEAGKLTFQLNEQLIDFLTDPHKVGKLENDIIGIQKEVVDFLIGVQSQKSPGQKREIEGYEVIEVLQQEPNFVEYLVKPKGVTSSIRKRIKEYSLQVNGLTPSELSYREDQIKNQYMALNKIKAKPFILNVEFKIDEQNHLFYEISDFLDENSLRAEARSKTFTFDEKLNIIRNVMAALKESHKENIYHRDINPDNVFLISGYAYLGNFGKSYFSDHNEQGFTVMATINESNATPYHPLELTIGDASRASDIYSLGVLIYWLFAEKEPIKSPYELDKLGGKLPADRLPTAINPSLPKWLNEICLKTILVDDTRRIDSIEELDNLLTNFLKSEGSSKESAKPITKPNTPQDPYDLKEGDQVDVYTIYQVLGKGGYSTVFKVKHGLQGKEFALKLFNQSVNANSVIDEYTALVDLHHPNILKFVWNGTLPTGQFYTLTELLHGENLSAYTRTDARLPVNRVYQVGKNILSALVEMQAQQKPILHRDIKPQNIIWDKEERFVLIDFNVASSTETNKDFVGTNPYLAPDLVTDNYKVNWDKSADTFALGITLYELACKQHPWAQKVPSLSLQPLNPKTVEPRLSTSFSDFLAKAISAKKENRFANAQDMLNALLAIGEDNLLEENKTGHVVKVNSEGEEQNFLAYVNSLYSQSKYGNAGTRASFETSAYDTLTYTPTKLDKKLIPAILDGHFKLVIITGNAGDGKTAFIRKIEDAESVTNRERFAHKNGARFRIGSVAFESNYDGSQDEDEKANNEVLESFFKPFENLTSYNNAAEGRIIAINEGRLVEFLQTSDKHHQLANIIEDYFYQEGHRDLPDGVMIINLNLRSVVTSEQAHPSLFREQVKALTKKELWSKCDTCPVANQCFIKYNVDSFNDMAAGEEVITRMEWLLRTASLKREMHITMRDLRSFIAFTLTRDNTCEDVKQLLNGDTPESYWEYFYFNVTNLAAKDGGEQDRLVKLLRETDIGEVTVPNLDRDLFFGKHHSRNYLEFAERDLNLISAFNEHKIYVPAHEQNSLILNRIKRIQKNFIRYQYFEGKAPYKKRLPYQSVFEFFDVLKSDNQQNKAILETKASISRAVSLNEGCDNQGIDQNFLVLSSSEVKDPYSSSYRLFPLDDFELFVNRTDHLVKYLEYEPDSLIFRHNKEKHIQLIISLDLYEMLYFIQKGFSPSLNDLKGKFIELIIFKNLLENLSYHKVVVTRDNLNFFKIEKEANNTLNIQRMDVEYGY